MPYHAAFPCLPWPCIRQNGRAERATRNQLHYVCSWGTCIAIAIGGAFKKKTSFQVSSFLLLLLKITTNILISIKYKCIFVHKFFFIFNMIFYLSFKFYLNIVLNPFFFKTIQVYFFFGPAPPDRCFLKLSFLSSCFVWAGAAHGVWRPWKLVRLLPPHLRLSPTLILLLLYAINVLLIYHFFLVFWCIQIGR